MRICAMFSTFMLCTTMASIFRKTSKSYLPIHGIPYHMTKITVHNSGITTSICGANCDAIPHCFLFCIHEAKCGEAICVLITKERSEDDFTWPIAYSSLDMTCMVKSDKSLKEQFGISIALNKTAKQSSVFRLAGSFDCEAYLAVDGNYYSDAVYKPFANGTSLAMTAENANDNVPWWQVDLGTQHLVVGVSVFRRFEHEDRSKNIDVRVGNVAFVAEYVMQTENQLCFHDESNAEKVLTRKCDNLIIGRYVSVQKLPRYNANGGTQWSFLNMAEVDVFGFEL